MISTRPSKSSPRAIPKIELSDASNPDSFNSMKSIGLIGLLALALPAHAGILVSIDTDPSTPSTIDSVWAASSGNTRSVNLVIELETSADSLSSYAVSVRFDNLELTLNGDAVENNPSVVDLGNSLEPDTSGVLFQTNDRTGGAAAGTDDGQVRVFEAGTFGTGPAGLRRWVVGTIPFKVLSPVTDGFLDIRPGLFSGLDGFFDNDGNEVVPTFAGAQVTLVPEPQSSALVLVALCALAAAGRRAWPLRTRVVTAVPRV